MTSRRWNWLSELIAAHISHAHLFEAESHQSRRDPLTGLPNRRDFEERLPVELSRASRSARPVSLCLFDLDGEALLADADRALLEAKDRLYGRFAG